MAHTTRKAIGGAFRDMLFFPLHSKAEQAQAVIEKRFGADFWKTTAPLDLNYPYQDRIRKEFSVTNETIRIPVGDKEVALTYRMMLWKGNGNGHKPYNFVFIPGNFWTIESSISGVYPFLASYLLQKDQDKTLPPARFIVTTQYDIKLRGAGDAETDYKPETIDEAGYILRETLRQLHEKWGKIDHLFAHSLGTILFARALKQMPAKEDSLPTHLTLHCAPSSIHEKRKQYWGGILLLQLAKLGKWDFDVETEVVKLCQREDRPKTIILSGVKQDHHFSGANLVYRDAIGKLQERGALTVLKFDPHRGLTHQIGHHGMSCDKFHGGYVEAGSSAFIKEGEHYAHALVRHSIRQSAEASS